MEQIRQRIPPTMPELPEVETVCRSLRPHVVERQITAVHA
ncbi:MAG: hypothetical protein HON70_46465, partial [Lentisphaerae bacterium]|nr:hypothetical protein [Lentisphaerota bacterium]